MSLKQVSLEDTYRKSSGKIYTSGNQAQTRLPLVQKLRDRVKGLKTTGYITEYRDSPIAHYSDPTQAPFYNAS